MKARKKSEQGRCSRRDVLVHLTRVAGVGALAGAWPSPVWAAESKTPPPGTEQDDGQVVGTARLRPDVRAAIRRGLEYLARPELQKEDGGWTGQYTVAFTSTALMAYMLQGNVPGRGRYGKRMEAGISYLIANGRSQRGLLATPGNHQPMYEHGLGVLALSEAWGQSKNPRIRYTLRRGVDLLLESQNREGGWRYRPHSEDADLSVTVMQFVALMSAKEAGIVVPRRTVDRAVKYIMRCQDPESGGFNYQPDHPGGLFSLYRTPAAVLCLILSGKRRHPATLRGIAALRKEVKESKLLEGITSPFHHYYAIQAMYQLSEADFQSYYSKVTDVLVSQQQPDGSWNNVKHSTGRAWRASMAILVLGVPYRYLPIYQR